MNWLKVQRFWVLAGLRLPVSGYWLSPADCCPLVSAVCNRTFEPIEETQIGTGQTAMAADAI